MTLFPNAKINIGLWVTSLRNDGYHNIESLFYPLGVRDACEFVMQDRGIDSDEFTQTGIDTGIRMSDNLVIKAINRLRAHYNIPALKVHLHKAIPYGAGLGGGSSDAAFVLRYLNRYFRLGICNNELKSIAADLGSDCPFFIENVPAIASGRGEILERTEKFLSGYHILLVKPGININTARAYNKIIPEQRNHKLLDLLKEAPSTWKNTIVNDFETPVFKEYPLLGEIKSDLYKAGAVYSSMSGSGSAIFGIFDDSPPQNIFDDFWQWSGML